jgi:hypothetical protein
LIYDNDSPDAGNSCEYSMNSNLMGTRQFPEISVLQNQSDISLITQNTNQNDVAHHVIIPLTIIPFSKKDTKNNAIMYVDTVFGNIIAPNLSSITPLLRIEHLSNKMIEIRDDIIQTGKKVFSQDVQRRLLQSPLIQERFGAELNSISSSISSQGNSRSIFQYLSEKYEILDFVQITSPIFLSPVILHKGWVITLKETIEAKYRFTISRIEGYDTSRCENFVRMIAHKNIKDTVEKWYNNILIRYGYKLLTKKPKGDKCIVSQIVINHPAIDNRFQSSHIYIVKTKATFGESINTSFRSGTVTSNETDEDDRVREEQRILTDAIVYEFETSMCASGTINTSNETIGVDMERTDGGIYDVPEGDNDVEDEGKRFLHSCYDHFDDIDFFLIIVFDFVQIMMKFVSLMVSQFLLLT